MAPTVPTPRHLPGVQQPGRQVSERAGGGGQAQLGTEGLSRVSGAVGRVAAAGRGMLNPVEDLLDKSVRMFEDIAVMEVDNKLADLDRRKRAELEKYKGKDASGVTERIRQEFADEARDTLGSVYTLRSTMAAEQRFAARDGALAGYAQQYENQQIDRWSDETERSKIVNLTNSMQELALSRGDGWNEGYKSFEGELAEVYRLRGTRKGDDEETIRAATEKGISLANRQAIKNLVTSGNVQNLDEARALFKGRPGVPERYGEPGGLIGDAIGAIGEQRLATVTSMSNDVLSQMAGMGIEDPSQVETFVRNYYAGHEEADNVITVLKSRFKKIETEGIPANPKAYSKAVSKATSVMTPLKGGKQASTHDLATKYAKEFKVPLGNLLTFLNTESSFSHYWESDGVYGGNKGDKLHGQPYKKGDVKRSPTGATGFGQFTEETWKQAEKAIGVKDRNDPEQNMRATAWLLGKLVKTMDGDIAAAYAAYNAGTNYKTPDAAINGFIRLRGGTKKGEKQTAEQKAKGERIWAQTKGKILSIAGTKVSGTEDKSKPDVESKTYKDADGNEITAEQAKALVGDLAPKVEVKISDAIAGTPGVADKMLPEHRAEIEGLLGRETQRVAVNKAVDEAYLKTELMVDVDGESQRGMTDKQILDEAYEEHASNPNRDAIIRGLKTRFQESEIAKKEQQEQTVESARSWFGENQPTSHDAVRDGLAKVWDALPGTEQTSLLRRADVRRNSLLNEARSRAGDKVRVTADHKDRFTSMAGVLYAAMGDGRDLTEDDGKAIAKEMEGAHPDHRRQMEGAIARYKQYQRDAAERKARSGQSKERHLPQAEVEAVARGWLKAVDLPGGAKKVEVRTREFLRDSFRRFAFNKLNGMSNLQSLAAVKSAMMEDQLKIDVPIGEGLYDTFKSRKIPRSTLLKSDTLELDPRSGTNVLAPPEDLLAQSQQVAGAQAASAEGEIVQIEADLNQRKKQFSREDARRIARLLNQGKRDEAKAFRDALPGKK